MKLKLFITFSGLDHEPEFIVSEFKKFIGQVLSESFAITVHHDTDLPVYEISSYVVEDLYHAGMIGYHLEDREQAPKFIFSEN